MHGLFFQRLSDLGPCCLGPDTPPNLTQITGPKLSRLRSQLRETCPARPGIYGMIDPSGELIYIGKAKSLRGRLLSYFRSRSRGPKAGKILRQTHTILWEICQSEFAALHRELELIRRWRPRWNVQGQPLRRKLTFLCLGRRPAPHIFLARLPPKNVLAVHGPLPAGTRTHEAVRRLNDLFRLRDCPQAQEMIFPEQGELFPIVAPAGCLRVEIGTCLGPCTGTCSQRDYRAQVRAARDFLAGHDNRPLEQLEADMQAASRAQHFERAAVFRDRLESLRWLSHRLQLLRHARERMSFIYPIQGWQHTTWWYLVHGGRTLAAFPEPADADSRRSAATRIADIYQGKKPELLLDSYEHVDSMMLVMAWFRKFPEERNRTLEPSAALAQCHRPV